MAEYEQKGTPFGLVFHEFGLTYLPLMMCQQNNDLKLWLSNEHIFGLPFAFSQSPKMSKSKKMIMDN